MTRNCPSATTAATRLFRSAAVPAQLVVIHLVLAQLAFAKIALAQLPLAQPPIMQPTLDSNSAAHLRDEYLIDLDVVHKKIISLADSIPAEQYAWRPSSDVRSVSEVLMHVAGEWYAVVPVSIDAKPPTDFGDAKAELANLEKIVTKPKVLEQLRKSWAYCSAAIRAANPTLLTAPMGAAHMSFDRMVIRVEGDQHEHLGQLIAYARSLGVKPAWSN